MKPLKAKVADSKELYVKKLEEQNENLKLQLKKMYSIISELDKCDSCKLNKTDFMKFVTEENIISFMKNNDDFVLEKTEKDLNYNKMGKRMFFSLLIRDKVVREQLLIRLYERNNTTKEIMDVFNYIWDNYIIEKSNPVNKRRGRKGLVSFLMTLISNGEF
jgi:hypothetical protein